MPKPGILSEHFSWLEKAAVAIALMAVTAVLFIIDYWVTGDVEYIAKSFLVKLAFLPMHALVLTIIIEELLAFREKKARSKKLHIFLGIFFRQMGVNFYVSMSQMVENLYELEQVITVHPQWRAKDFRRARIALGSFPIKMRADHAALAEVFDLLHEREADIIEMTRNPDLWEFEHLYRALLALFHLIEESHFRGNLEELGDGTIQHLSRDVGKALLHLLWLWLEYLEFLKSEHPVLFNFKVGVHNTVQPVMMDSRWSED